MGLYNLKYKCTEIRIVVPLFEFVGENLCRIFYMFIKYITSYYWCNDTGSLNIRHPSILNIDAGTLEPIPGDLRHKEGDTLDVMPTHNKAHTQTHTHQKI